MYSTMKIMIFLSVQNRYKIYQFAKNLNFKYNRLNNVENNLIGKIIDNHQLFYLQTLEHIAFIMLPYNISVDGYLFI